MAIAHVQLLSVRSFRNAAIALGQISHRKKIVGVSARRVVLPFAVFTRERQL